MLYYRSLLIFCFSYIIILATVGCRGSPDQTQMSTADAVTLGYFSNQQGKQAYLDCDFHVILK